MLCLAALGLIACDNHSHNSAHQQGKAKHKTVVPAGTSEVPSQWEMQKQSKKETFLVKLSCQKSPFVGDFQVCQLSISHQGVGVTGAKISIDGGMQAHGHGLPTTPVANSTGQQGEYSIDGLSFSMPGEWLLGFKIVSEQGADEAIFKFTI